MRVRFHELRTLVRTICNTCISICVAGMEDLVYSLDRALQERANGSTPTRRHMPIPATLPSLPAELLVEIAGCLPAAADIARLSMTTRRTRAVLSSASDLLANRIIATEMSRLQREFDCLDFSNVPIDVALRQYGSVYGRPWLYLHQTLQLQGWWEVVNRFCLGYGRANPQLVGESSGGVRWFADEVMEVSNAMEWYKVKVESRNFEPHIQKPRARYTDMRWEKAFLDAIDPLSPETEPAQRYRSLVRRLRKSSEFMSRLSESELVEMLQRLDAEPLIDIRMSDRRSVGRVTWITSPSIGYDGVSIFLPPVVKDKVRLPTVASGTFNYGLGVTRDVTLWDARYWGVRDLGENRLQWAALLQYVVVIWT